MQLRSASAFIPELFIRKQAGLNCFLFVPPALHAYLWRTGYSPLCLLLKLEDSVRTLNRTPTGQPQFLLDQGSLSSSGVTWPARGKRSARTAPERRAPPSWTEALLDLPSPARCSLASSPLSAHRVGTQRPRIHNR